MCLFEIFDLRWCYAEMKRQSQSAQMAVVAQAAAVAGLMQPMQTSGCQSAFISPQIVPHHILKIFSTVICKSIQNPSVECRAL
jgi:hypothetical protein